MVELMIINKILVSTLTVGTIYLIATLGEILAERSGVVNLGVEGLMEIGATVGILVALLTENALLGFSSAFVIAAIIAAIHAFTSVTLKLNQFASGLAIYIFGLGIAITVRECARSAYAHLLLKISKVRLYPIRVPGLSDIPVIGAFFNVNVMVYIAIVMAVIMWFILFKTSMGLSIRSVGENPAAADAAGINVYRVRYLCVIIGGGFAGLAGAYLMLGHTAQVMGAPIILGRGWIAIALVIFSFWNPLRALLGAYLFGGLEVAYYWLQSIPALRSYIPLLVAIPHTAAIILLTLMSIEALRKRIGAPAALGVPYSRE
ncbi:MAG: ABC transporter permease [Desulfurococcales archaeon ex4484_42]|nr:MAG: ABC transporter permease [Desulfurococcales archaeon ex4484_42]